MYANAGAIRPGTIEDLIPPGKGGGEPWPTPLPPLLHRMEGFLLKPGTLQSVQPGGRELGPEGQTPGRKFYRLPENIQAFPFLAENRNKQIPVGDGVDEV